MQILVMVLDDPELLTQVLKAWSEAGIPGATITESWGIRRICDLAGCEEVSTFLGFTRVTRPEEVNHFTLFSVVEDMDIIERAVAATEKIVGEMDQPHTGLMFTLPVTKVWGIPKCCTLDQSTSGQNE
jgi:nitrogen regulatory protein P-II 1